MKLLLDFLPLVFFFATFKYAEMHKAWAAAFASEYFGFMVSGGVVGTEEGPVLLATLVVMVCTLAQAAIIKLRGKKIDLMLWISLGLVVVLGGLTIWFHNETFIKWKPSGLYWAMALVFWFSQAFLGKNLIKAMLGQDIELKTPAAWLTLNRIWVLFFALMGVLNLYVAYNYSTSTWASFKVFGVTGLLIVFMLAQAVYLGRHMADQAAEDQTPPSPEGTTKTGEQP